MLGASLPQWHHPQQHQTLPRTSRVHAHQGLHAGQGGRCRGQPPGDPPWPCTATQQLDSLPDKDLAVDTKGRTGSQGRAQKGNRPKHLLRIKTSVNRSFHTCLPLEDRSWSSSLSKLLLWQLAYQHPRMQKLSWHVFN